MCLSFRNLLLEEVTSADEIKFYTEEYDGDIFECIKILSEEYPVTILNILRPHNGTGTPKGIGTIEDKALTKEIERRLSELLEEHIDGFLSRLWSYIPVTKIEPGPIEDFHTSNSFCYMQDGRIYTEG